MGARTLESNLRLRALALLAPLVVGVGAASFALAFSALGELETDTARGRAETALRLLESEDDGPDVAVREVVRGADADGVRILVRTNDPPLEKGGWQPMPGGLARLAPGSCAIADDADDAPWRACAARSKNYVAVVAIPIGKDRAVLRTLGVSLGVVVLLALLGAALAVRVAVRRSLLGVRALAAWSEKVAAGDARPKSAPRGDAAEVARLGAVFDDVVGRLFEALERERANSAHIAHELRTPLTAIRAELETLAGDGESAATRMLGDVARLESVIDAVLVLSAPAPRAPATTVVNLADLVRDVAPRGADVDAPDEALIEGDPRLLELALRNLVDNAKKHGERAEALAVERLAGDAVRVAVRDGGPGLDEGARGRMFERYWRASADQGGSGLGLALVRAVAERHGGRAEARESPTGRGLELSMTFPRLLVWHAGTPRTNGETRSEAKRETKAEAEDGAR